MLKPYDLEPTLTAPSLPSRSISSSVLVSLATAAALESDEGMSDTPSADMLAA